MATFDPIAELKKVRTAPNAASPPGAFDPEEELKRVRDQKIVEEQAKGISHESPKDLAYRKSLEPTSGGFTMNVLKSGAMLPVNVVKGVFALPGMMETLGGTTGIPDYSRVGQLVEGVWDEMKNRYGGVDRILNTAYTDPVGLAADVSAVVSGGGALLKGAGKVAELSSLAKVGKVVSAAGSAIDPIQIALKATKPVLEATGKGLAGVSGWRSGAGSKKVRAAFNEHSRDFTEAMRGKTQITDILEGYRDALQEITNDREVRFKADLNNIHGQLSKQPVKDAFISALDDKDVKAFKVDKKGKASRIGIDEIFDPLNKGESIELNFGNSFIKRGIEEVIDTYQEIRKQKDTTALGMEKFRSRIYENVKKARPEVETAMPVGDHARDVISSTHDALMNSLKDNVTGYEEMSKSYMDATKFLNEVKQELGNPTGKGAAMKRLQAASKDDAYAQTLAEAVDSKTGVKYALRDKLAGYAFSSVWPKYFRSLPIASAFLWALRGLHPAMLTDLVMSSPRAVGEISSALGKTSRAVAKVKPVAPVYAPLRALGESQ